MTSIKDVMLSDKQKVVFNWLHDELQLPMYATVYKGACDLLYRKSPGYIVFVCHAGRDLMNGLAPAVRGRKRLQAEYVNFFDDLQNRWEDMWGAEGLNNGDWDRSSHLIPHKICKKIRCMIAKHKEARLRPKEVAALFCTTFLGYDDEAIIPPNFFEEWLDTRDWFLGFTHLGNEDYPLDLASEILKQFQTLDNLLHVAATSAFGRMRTINEILEETNR